MSLPFRDRSVALAIVGGLEVIAGLGLLAMSLLLGFVLTGNRATLEQAGAQPGSIALSIALYASLGVAALVLGGGLMACRRWARALSPIASWGLAAVGAIIAVAYVFIMPVALREVGSAGGSAPPVPVWVITVLSVAFAVCVLFLPGLACALILGSENARLTCEWRDRQERWTDRCPLPVLALALMNGLSAVFMVPSGFASPAIVGTRVVTGPAAVAFYASLGVVMALVAWGLYRLRPWAWWSLVALYAIGLVNSVVLLRSHALDQLYREMGMPEDQVRMASSILAGPGMLVLLALSFGGLATWLLLVRRHFVPRTA